MNTIKKSKLLVVIIAILTIGQFFSRVEALSFLNYLDEIVLLVIPLFFIIRKWVCYYVLFIVLCIPSLLNESSVIVQFILDQKFLATAVLFFILAKNIQREQITQLFLMLSVFNTVVVVFEILFPSVYQYFFYGDYLAKFRLLGFNIYRVNGIFSHPGELSVFSALTLFWVAIKENHAHISKFKMFFLGSTSLVFLIVTFQRAEIFSFVLVFIIFIAYPHNDFSRFFIKHLKIIMLVSIVLGFLILSFGSPMALYPEDEARAVLYKGSAILLSENLFSGVGPGNFGSMLRENTTYYYQQLGIDSYWWYQLGRYITDTFWPKIIAEYGLIGALAWVMIINKVASQNQQKISQGVWFFILLISLQAPIYFNVKLIFFTLAVSHAYKKQNSYTLSNK